MVRLHHGVLSVLRGVLEVRDTQEGRRPVNELEKRVVQLAIEMRNEMQGRHTRMAREDTSARFLAGVNALIYGCPECNTERHVCPGDGNPVGHGDTDCGEHDEPQEELQWVLRTWQDVRVGDRVRMPGTDITATVAGAVLMPWHVHPAADPYHPERSRCEWSAMRVQFMEDGVRRDMDPAKPVEIELTASEVAAIELLGDWENRVGVERT